LAGRKGFFTSIQLKNNGANYTFVFISSSKEIENGIGEALPLVKPFSFLKSHSAFANSSLSIFFYFINQIIINGWKSISFIDKFLSEKKSA